MMVHVAIAGRSPPAGVAATSGIRQSFLVWTVASAAMVLVLLAPFAIALLIARRQRGRASLATC